MNVTKDGLKDRQLHIEDYLEMASAKQKEVSSTWAIVSIDTKEKACICANMRNGNWYCSGYFVFQTTLNNKKLRELGYPTFREFFLKICEN